MNKEFSAGTPDDSSTNVDGTSVSPTCPKPIVSGMCVSVGSRTWQLVQNLKEWQLWTAGYWCPDGDGVELYISNEEESFELFCFSGLGMSKIVMHDVEFSYLSDKVDIDFKKPFEVQCVQIADYFCRLFCEYSEVSHCH